MCKPMKDSANIINIILSDSTNNNQNKQDE